MTCREFKQNTEALTLWELTRVHDERVLEHAQQCESCCGWLQEQRKLAASLQTLQVRTATLEASPKVEQALLQALRQNAAQATALAQSAPAMAKSEKRRANGDLPTPVVARSVLRLSRWFEVGAYVAVAAAILVGLFLGVRLLQHNSQPAPVQSQRLPAVSRPESSKQATATVPEPARVAPANASKRQVASARTRPHANQASSEKASVSTQPSTVQELQPDNTGYVPLMFCDPLSCAADSQVVRMELPPNSASQSSQPQLADVVVGYDGVVRAVRMVN